MEADVSFETTLLDSDTNPVVTPKSKGLRLYLVWKLVSERHCLRRALLVAWVAAAKGFLRST